MRHLRELLCLLLLLPSGSGCTGSAEASGPASYDIVIYGGTSAGVAAAVQAARMDRSVVLIAPGEHLGGLSSGGLGWTDSGDKSAVGGVSREFYQRIKAHYDRDAAWIHEEPEDFGRYRPGDDAMWVFAPHVAEGIFDELVQEEDVPVFRNERLDREDGVVTRDGRIISIRTLGGRSFAGEVFIDATYEGDLLAAAGVSYTVGREPNDTYDETLNGVQKARNVHAHRFREEVDPYVVPGDSSSGLVPRVHGGDPGEDGEGDHRVQAYCFRMCMTDVPENRVPWPKPEGYDAAEYELLLRNFEAGDHRLPLKIDLMPNRKTDTNNRGAFSTDNIGKNYAYPEASYEEREAIIAEHERYQKGLMWTLANHPRVPESIREEVGRWGLAKDEFVDNGHWPHQIYVREARRMVGEYVMTERDCRRTRKTPQPVGLGSYNMDSHNCQRYVTGEGHVQNEGDIQVSPGGSYQIAYGALVPKEEDCRNLLVPACVSSSHIAYGSIRMEPVFMILGQSAATAAVHAIEEETDVQGIDYARLRDRLLADGQVLDITAPPRPAGVEAASLDGIVLDDDEATPEGAWIASTSVGPYVGRAYRHDGDAEKGGKSVRYELEVAEAGRYEVRWSYTDHENRATNVPVTVRHADGEKTLRIDQTKAPPIDGLFASLGTYRFEPGETAAVLVSNEGTDGYVITDAVQLVPAD